MCRTWVHLPVGAATSRPSAACRRRPGASAESRSSSHHPDWRLPWEVLWPAESGKVFQIVRTWVYPGLESKGGVMGRGGIIWTVVGILLIIALIIYIL